MKYILMVTPLAFVVFLACPANGEATYHIPPSDPLSPLPPERHQAYVNLDEARDCPPVLPGQKDAPVSDQEAIRLIKKANERRSDGERGQK